MTSVLVECGFLTNEAEANYLNTTSGQDILSSAIFRGFRTFITKEHPTISFVRKSTPEKEEKNEPAKEEEPNESGTLHIQLMSSKEPIDPASASFKKIGLKITRTKLTTTSAYKYRYTAGPYKDKEAAKKDLEKVQKNGFKDAYFIKL